MSKRNGFTLPELVITLLILSVLAIIVVPKIIIYTELTRLAAFETNHDGLKWAMTSYASENDGVYPDDIEKLVPYIADDVHGDPESFFSGKPKGAQYVLDENGTLTSTLSDVNVERISQDEPRLGSFLGTTYILVFNPQYDEDE